MYVTSSKQNKMVTKSKLARTRLSPGINLLPNALQNKTKSKIQSYPSLDSSVGRVSTWGLVDCVGPGFESCLLQKRIFRFSVENYFCT